MYAGQEVGHVEDRVVDSVAMGLSSLPSQPTLLTATTDSKMSLKLNKLSSGPGLVIDDLLELPRPSTAIPNPSSTLAIWPSSLFSFSAAEGKGRTERSISLIDLPTSADPAFISNDADVTPPKLLLTGLAYGEATWLDDKTILFLRPDLGEKAFVGEDGKRVDHPVQVSDVEQSKRMKEGGEGIEVWAKDVDSGEEYLVGKLPVVVSNLQVVNVSSSKESGAILAFSATVYPDGDIYAVSSHKKASEEAAEGSDGRTYDTLFVRHWDTWASTDGEKTQLHFVRLSRNPDGLEEEDGFEHVEYPVEEGEEKKEGRWSFVGKRDGLVEGVKGPTVKSPMAGTTLECPVGAFGSSGDFDLSTTHLIFHSKDPHVSPAWHTRTNIYLVPLSPKSASDAKPKALTIGTQGACSSPRFSKDGKRVVWLEMREDGYEADRNRVMVYEIGTGERYGVTEEWDRSPSGVEWCPCGEKIYLITEDEARVKLYQLSVPLKKLSSYPEPTKLTHKSSISSAVPLSTSSVLLTSSSLTSPNVVSLLTLPSSLEGPPSVQLKPLSSFTKHLAEEKELDKGEMFWFPGTKGTEVQGWVVFPPGFDEVKKGKKWPLAFLVHGGPQSAWTDSWSTRWNPQIYASHGYITVTINPTGSTGFGQEFCDAIKDNWGGSPFQDLVAGLNFVKEAYPVDEERMAMLGASYGGFMANFIQGHNEQMGFKCIVCHDGVFSTTNTWYGTEELYFPEREFGGMPWTAAAGYSKYNPVNFISKWRTPQLVIHGGRDYRLNESEGIGCFNTLQRLGIPSRFLYFGSENHWVLSAHNGRRWHKEVLKWIDEWTSENEVAKTEKTQAQAPKRSGYNPSYLTNV